MTSLCAICNSQLRVWRWDLSSVFTRETKSDNYQLSRCTHCSHIETRPIPSDQLLAEIYQRTYPYDIHRAVSNEKSLRASNLLREFNLDVNLGRTLCDLGCGGGELSELAARLGYQAVGVDIVSSVLCSESFRFVQMNIENFVEQYASEKFQIVVMSHSLEHQRNPKRILESVRLNLLAQDGHLVVVVPNSESQSARIFGSKWGYWQVPVHLHHFNSKSFEHLASTAGFEIKGKRIRGGDSLFLALTLMNVLGMSQGRSSKLRVCLAKVWSFLFKLWMFVGDEDAVYVLKQKAQPE